MPSTEKNKFILEKKVVVCLNDMTYECQIYDTSLGHRFLEALEDNLRNKRILEKNFCFLGFADSQRNLHYLCNELNKNIDIINSFDFDPAYKRIHYFSVDDFQFSNVLPIGRDKPGKKLKHEACNRLHRFFEELQGTAWKVSKFYLQANESTKYAIRQLNNLCHEIESWVNSDRKKAFEPEWMRPSQITTFINAPRYNLKEQDFELFKQNRYDRELGGVYLHWSQVGKTLYEVFRDEGAPKMTEAMCSEVNHQKYYSGEFDVEWGQTITEEQHDFKKTEMDQYRKWLEQNNFDWNDPKLSLGYIKIGQIDIVGAFGENATLQDIHNVMNRNLNINSIKITGDVNLQGEFPYTLDSDDWKQIQIDNLRSGYESRGVC